MKLEFKVFSLKENSIYLKSLKSSYEKIDTPRHKFKNEFIVVGEDKNYYKAQQLHEKGMTVFGGIDIAFIALEIPKEDFIWNGTIYTQIDIPKENLTMEIIEDIQRLNA